MTSTPPKKTKPNAIVVCCTPNWLPAAACTLKSCADQGGAEVADFYVAAMGLSDKDREDFQTFQSRNNFTARIIDGVLPQKLIDIATRRFSAAAFLRLTLDQTLDPGYRRVLYLDSDILALQPIGSIFDIDLHGKYLGAVEDYQSLPSRFGKAFEHPRSIGLKPGERYFNSGVLMFDWQEILKHKLLPQCVDRILAQATAKKKFSFPDQDIMNLVFAGRWHRLPMAYNLMSVMSDYFPERPIFRHFTKGHKPWQNVWMPGFTEFKKQYVAMLQNSPWASMFKTKMTRIAPIESLGIILRRRDTASRDRYLKHLES